MPRQKIIKKLKWHQVDMMVMLELQTIVAEIVADKVNGGTVVTVASSVEAFHGIGSYFDLFDYNVDQLVRAFQATPGP